MNKVVLIILLFLFSTGVSYAQNTGSPPSNIQADIQSTKVILTWTPSTGSYMNRNESDSDHILVYTNPDFTGTKILDGGVNGGNNRWEMPINTSGAYGTVRPGVTYHAKIISFNAPCNCSSGVQITFTVPNTTTIAPTAAQPVCSGIPSDRGLVTMPITVTEGGSYTIWSRMMSQGATSDSFYIKIDDQCPILVGNSTTIQPNIWSWVNFSGNDGVVMFQIAPGNHIVQLLGNEGGTRVDKILLSNSNCTPTGMGDNCTMIPSTPIPTPVPPTNTPTPTAFTPTNPPTGSTPTVTTLPNSTFISLIVKLHGLGTGGDNKNPNGGGNTSPTRTLRELSLRIYNASNQDAGKAQLTITFDPATGTYKGNTAITAPPGPYQIKLESQGFLKKTYPGIYTFGPNEQITLPTIALVTGDSIPDNKLDLLDYNLLMNCFSDFAPAKSCTPAQKTSTDLTDDTIVNQNDYNLLIRELSAQAGD